MKSFDKILTIKAINLIISTLEEYRSQPSQRYGLCSNLSQEEVEDVWGSHRDAVYHSWEKYSGSPSYPVPCPNKGSSDMVYHFTGNKLEGEYGELRKELVAHAIEYYKELLDFIKIIETCEDYLKESYQERGLCSDLVCDMLTSSFFKHTSEINRSWARFSGSLEFPVPSPNEEESSVYAYFASDNKLEGRYGELRKDYVNHVIKYFTSKIIQRGLI